MRRSFLAQRQPDPATEAALTTLASTLPADQQAVRSRLDEQRAMIDHQATYMAEQLAALQAVAAKLAPLQQAANAEHERIYDKLAELGGHISLIAATANEAAANAQHAASSSANAAMAASSAQQFAESAALMVDTAKDEAAVARSAADEATRQAKAAVTAATQANTTASTASSAAVAAETASRAATAAATAAQSAAATAASKADAATTTANDALAKANAALARGSHVRIGAVNVPILALGATADVAITWTTPMPGSDYAIDLAPVTSTLIGKVTATVKANSRTANGLTITLRAGLAVSVAGVALVVASAIS